MGTMETVTLTKIQIQFSLYSFKFYDCSKFHYRQVTGEKVIDNQNFQIFCFWQP